MKLLRYGPAGQEKPVVLLPDGSVGDLSSVVSDIAGGTLLRESLKKLAAIDFARLPRLEMPFRVGSCVAGVGKFPIGSWLVTSDEVRNIQELAVWLDVDNQRRQTGSTRTMIFRVAYLVSYVSNLMSLQPGDIISTGTPRGVGLGHKPPVYLRAGNVVRLGIRGLGEQRQIAVAYPVKS